MLERFREAVRRVVSLANCVVSLVGVLKRSVAADIVRAFDSYTGRSRRTLLFARYEARRYGTKAVESEHLLLGLLHNYGRLSDRIHRLSANVSRTESRRSATAARSEIRKEIEQRKPPGPKTPTTVDLPLNVFVNALR